MGTVNFDCPVQREVEDGLPIYFPWPRSGETITYQYSLDGGATYSPGSETITEVAGGGEVYYNLPYNSDERLSSAGIIIFVLTDGTDTGRLFAHYQAKHATEASSGSTSFTSYGPKRVRTKEMDIEQHDPEKMQRVESKDNQKYIPEFCDLPFCQGER